MPLSALAAGLIVSAIAVAACHSRPTAVDPCTGGLVPRFQWRKAPACAPPASPPDGGARFVPIQVAASPRTSPLFPPMRSAP